VAIALLPSLLLAWGILSTLDHSGAAVQAATAPGWNPATLPATDLFSFIHPGPWVHPNTPAMGNPGILHIAYLGLAGLALVLFARLRGADAPLPLARPTLLFAIVCLGPALSINRWSPGIPLPLALLYSVGPLDHLHHPYRFIGMALPLLGLWLGWASTSLPSSIRRAVPIFLVAETLYLSPVPWPLHTLDTEAPPIYAELPEGPILDWPADASIWNRRYLTWQTQHGQPVAVGVNVFITETLQDDPLVGELANQLTDLPLRARNRDVPFMGNLHFRGRADAQSLKSLGYRSVVLHRDALSPEEQQATIRVLESALGPADLQSGPDLAWEL